MAGQLSFAWLLKTNNAHCVHGRLRSFAAMRPKLPEPTNLMCRGLVSRIMAVFMGAWLFYSPQVMNASWMTNDDLGPPPVNMVEEEVKHADALPLVILGHMPALDRSKGHPPVPLDDHRTCGDHGEVPHPPPWS